MKAALLLTVFNVLSFVSPLPAPVQNAQTSCIVVTPEKQKQFKNLEKQISELLLKLEKQIGDIVITDATITIKKYTEKDANTDVNLTVSVNECDGVSNVITDKKSPEEDVVYFEEPSDEIPVVMEPKPKEQPKPKQELTSEQPQPKTPEPREESKVIEKIKAREQPKVIEQPRNTEKLKVIKAPQVIKQPKGNEEFAAEINNNSREESDSIEESYPFEEDVKDYEYENISGEKSSMDNWNFDSLSDEAFEDIEEGFSSDDNGSGVETTIPNEITSDIKENEQITPKESRSKPDMEVVIINLDEKEQKLVNDMEKEKGKKPFLLIQRGEGTREILFL